MGVEPITVKAPCCVSRRTCRDTFLAIIGIRGRPRLLRSVEATRCYRGEERIVEFYPSDDVILADVYITTRNNVYVQILWKPGNISEEDARRKVLEALGYTNEEVIA
jgi:hypothetical protein